MGLKVTPGDSFLLGSSEGIPESVGGAHFSSPYTQRPYRHTYGLLAPPCGYKEVDLRKFLKGQNVQAQETAERPSEVLKTKTSWVLTVRTEKETACSIAISVKDENR